MTPEAQRIACAELCGYTADEIRVWRDYLEAERQFQCAEIESEEYYKRHLRVELHRSLPDYLNDANTRPELLRMIKERGLQASFTCDIVRVLNLDKLLGILLLEGLWLGASLTQPQFVECVLRACSAWKEGE